MRKPKGEYSIQTVVNAMRLLEAFRDERELGVTELSRRLALHKNNVFRLLATLEQLGYIEQSVHNERYRLGVRAHELGESFVRTHTLLSRARPVLEELTASTGESSNLGILMDWEVVHVAGEQADHLVMTGSRVGRRLPLHCTALGKVLLACANDEVREAYDREVIARGKLSRETPETISDPHKLFEHLSGVAVQGYGVDVEECAPGLACVAAPVLDSRGRLAAALSVSGPRFRFDDSRLYEEIVPLVVEAGERISREFGSAR